MEEDIIALQQLIEELTERLTVAEDAIEELMGVKDTYLQERS